MGKYSAVLVIDDDDDIREIVGEALNEKFETVKLASNLAEGKEAISNNSFDAIILDINLNGENGGEIIQYLRENDTPNSGTSILVISGFITDDFKNRLKDRIDMLEKPFSEEQIFEKLDSIIKAATDSDDDLADLFGDDDL